MTMIYEGRKGQSEAEIEAGGRPERRNKAGGSGHGHCAPGWSVEASLALSLQPWLGGGAAAECSCRSASRQAAGWRMGGMDAQPGREVGLHRAPFTGQKQSPWVPVPALHDLGGLLCPSPRPVLTALHYKSGQFQTHKGDGAPSTRSCSAQNVEATMAGTSTSSLLISKMS